MKINDKIKTLCRFGHFQVGTIGIVKKMPFRAYEEERQVTVWFDLGLLLNGDNRLSGWEFEEVKHLNEREG